MKIAAFNVPMEIKCFVAMIMEFIWGKNQCFSHKIKASSLE
jgi:hypothetical protein